MDTSPEVSGENVKPQVLENYQGGDITLTGDNSVIINSYYEGAYDNFGNEFPATLVPPIQRAGFILKEGKYMSNIRNNSAARVGEVSYGSSIS